MRFISETEQQKSHRETRLLDVLIESRKGIWDEKYSHVQINESEHGITSCWRFDSPSFEPQIFSREAFLERAKQLKAITELRLTEEQAKVLAERMPKLGVLQILDDEPLCMSKRIEELEAQVRGVRELLTRSHPYISDQADWGRTYEKGLLRDIDATLAGELPEPAMPEGWKLVEKANCFVLIHDGQVIASTAGPTAERTAAILASALDGKEQCHAAPEGWQLVPVEPTAYQVLVGRNAKQDDDELCVAVYRAMLAATPSPDSAK